MGHCTGTQKARRFFVVPPAFFQGGSQTPLGERPCGPLGFVLTHGVEKATFAVHGWRGGYAEAWPSVNPPALAVTRQPQTISFCSYESRIFEGRHGSCGFLLVLDILVHSNIRPNDRFIQISYGCLPRYGTDFKALVARFRHHSLGQAGS